MTTPVGFQPTTRFGATAKTTASASATPINTTASDTVRFGHKPQAEAQQKKTDFFSRLWNGITNAIYSVLNFFLSKIGITYFAPKPTSTSQQTSQPAQTAQPATVQAPASASNTTPDAFATDNTSQEEPLKDPDESPTSENTLEDAHDNDTVEVPQDDEAEQSSTTTVDNASDNAPAIETGTVTGEEIQNTEPAAQTPVNTSETANTPDVDRPDVVISNYFSAAKARITENPELEAHITGTLAARRAILTTPSSAITGENNASTLERLTQEIALVDGILAGRHNDKLLLAATAEGQPSPEEVVGLNAYKQLLQDTLTDHQAQ